MMKFNEISRRCRLERTPDRHLEGEIFHTLHFVEDDKDNWSNNFTDDVWCRRDPNDGVAFDTPPPYTSSIDGALSARVRGMRLDSLRELVRTDSAGPEWKPWACRIQTSFRMFEGVGETAPYAILDAVMQAHGYLLDAD